MSFILNKLRWSIERRGVAGTLRAAAKSFGRKICAQPAPSRHPFDLAHGTDTAGLISGGDLASGHLSDRYIEGYAAVPPSRFQGILARWQASNPAHALTAYTFIDIGCGKGRALLLASEAGFREVVGVELNPSLVAVAQANVDLWVAAGKPRCPIRIVQGDAAEFAWPAGPCVVFLFNPFGAPLMRRFADCMAAEFADRASDLEVLYLKSEQADAFAISFDTIWCEATGISCDDLARDPVADPKDQTSAYRLRQR